MSDLHDSAAIAAVAVKGNEAKRKLLERAQSSEFGRIDVPRLIREGLAF
jgi:hypothetical protein